MKVHYPLVFSTLFMRIGAGAIVVQVLSNWLWRSTPIGRSLCLRLWPSPWRMLSLAHLGRPKRI